MRAELPPPAAALFADLAGVLLDTTPGGSTRTGCGLRAGAGAALRLLERLDYRIIVLAPCALDRRRASSIRQERVADLLFRERVMLAGFCSCSGTGPRCDACPPAPGMLVQAARAYGVALAASWLLASGAPFLAAGQRAGWRTCSLAMAMRGRKTWDAAGRVRTGHGTSSMRHWPLCKCTKHRNR